MNPAAGAAVNEYGEQAKSSKISGGQYDIYGKLAETGGSIFSSALGFLSAERQMNFQERMSNTAHQRETKDMIAAGINPILSVTGGSGASQPSGSMYEPENPLQGLGQYVLERWKTNIQERVAQSQINLNNAQAVASGKLGNLHDAQAIKEIAETDWTKKDLERLAEQIGLISEEKRFTSAKAVIEEFKKSGAQRESELYSDPFWGKVLKVLPMVAPAAGAVGLGAMLRGGRSFGPQYKGRYKDKEFRYEELLGSKRSYYGGQP